MGEAAQLITAMAALVTAAGGAAAAIIVALGSLRKQRSAAAEEAIRLAPDPYRGRHERDPYREQLLRDFAGDAQESARGLTEMSRELWRDARFDRLEHPSPPPVAPPVPDPDGGSDG